MTTEGPPIRRLADWDAAALRDRADEYGTPLYVLDQQRVRENVAALRAAFHDEEISYAVKANTVRATLETVAETGLSAECASAGELQRAADAGFDRVRYTAVNPPAGDLDHVVELAADPSREDLDLVITVGAADAFEALARRGYDGPLAIRVNPGVGAGHHAKVTTGDAPKFGVPYDRVSELASEIVDRGFDLVGLHAHAGSGIHDEADLAAHRELVSRMGDLARELGHGLDFLNVGGGLGVPYRPEEEPLDLDSVAEATREAAGELDVRLGIEPGRYVVADAGVLLTTVNTVKPTPETTVVGVDAGMTTLLRPAMYDAYHEIQTLAPDAGERDPITAMIAGPICETADVLGRDRELPRPERGDVLAIGNAGAYGYEMASNYNSRPRPAVVSIGGGEPRLAVERETLSDLTRLEVEQ
ncbi:diaminopimelate decarboxylase [Halapricum hydrolyticum]|uniref:Diaminopimelate decarboxylase n=1 Tax=Halapricum hydrolyticum TaxID=2979991 RepID=A0AAE3IF68_9EURY|nr:diaminopimelate decarboxylase [Halapricum hydrolyticum]MCU4719533.1 diaminopimelate decarboxylase [Halapricum hydrolyticum]MCU4728183.1 diaminopimelate decarboxylase [Halapricum hydrolyticum]